MSEPETAPEIVQYQPRRVRGQYVLSTRPGQRKRGRWQVIAAHHLVATHPKDYSRMDIEPTCRTNATTIANALNALNNLPPFQR